MKLTKQAVKELSRIIEHLNRAHSYIQGPDLAICHKGNYASTTDHYTRDKDKTTLLEVNKDYGSNITGLEMGLSHLKRFVETHM